MGDTDYEAMGCEGMGVVGHYDCVCGLSYDVYEPIEGGDENKTPPA